MRYAVNPRVIVEVIDDEVLVCDLDGAVVHRLSGVLADIVQRVQASSVPMELETDVSLDELLSAGILVCVDAAPRRRRLTRRRAVTVGTAVTAAGLVTLALPKAAAASSGDPPPAALTAEPTVRVGPESGVVLINWTDLSFGEFKYFVTVSVISGPGEGTSWSGELSSGTTASTGFNLQPAALAQIIVTSITDPAASDTQYVYRPAPPAP